MKKISPKVILSIAILSVITLLFLISASDNSNLNNKSGNLSNNKHYDIFDLDTVYPSINFTLGTNENNTGRKEKFFTNISITEQNIANITWNFNGTNYFVSVVNPHNLTEGLVSYWHMDETSWNGTTGEVKDVLGRNNGTAINNSNTTSFGRYNRAGNFNGNQSITILNTDSLNLVNNLTISVWIKPNLSMTECRYYDVVAKDTIYSQGYGIEFYGCNNRVEFWTRGTSLKSVSWNYGSLSLIAGNWYNIIGIYNGTNLSIYVNGALNSTGVGVNPGSTINPLMIGYANSLSDFKFNGSIDEVMIYNRSLSSQEVKALYYSKLGIYQDENKYTLEYKNLSGTLNMTFESQDLSGVNYTLLVNQSNLSAGQRYNYYTTVIDLSGNTNSTETRTIIGNNPPTFPEISPFPELNYSDELDPGLNITLTLNLSDVNNNFDTAILEYKNSSVDWNQSTNITLENTTSKGFYTNFTGILPLPIYEDNITYRVWANDSETDSNTSSEFIVYSYWDCSWKASSELGATVGWNENKFIGNLTINNTGDLKFSNNNCTLLFRLTHDSTAGRIYFDNSSLKPSNSYNLTAKTVRNISINATFLTEVRQENVVITTQEITSLYGTNISNTAARNTTLSVVSNQQGPYLYQEVTYHPQILYLTPQNFSLEAYIRNLMGSDTINENNTAYNINFNWTLPSEFINTSGAKNTHFENITDSDLHESNLNVSFTDVSSMTPGIKSFYINAQGYNISNGSIKGANNNTLLSESVEITFLCYNETDNICVSNCGYLQDPDCSESSSAGGTGGGSGGGGTGVREEKSSASFELLSGKQQVFQLPIENKYSDPRENIKISVSGINSEYIKISPDAIDRIDPRSSKNITVIITAPAYFTKGQYNLTFVITGELKSKDTKEVITERKLVTLYIIELPKEETNSLITESKKIIEEMNNSKLVLTQVQILYQEILSAYNRLDYVSVKTGYEKIKELRDAAFKSQGIIDELDLKIKQAEKNGISVLETKKIIYTSKSAFARGDYVLALERLSEAKLTFAIETKGEFNLLSTVKNNPVKSGVSILGFALFALTASLVVRLSLYKKKLKALNEEEKLLLELMKVIQRECFTNNHMSMEEYEQAMSQYETRLSKSIEEKINTEAKIANLMKIKGKKKALVDERNRLVALVRKIQDDYMNKGIVETRIYENMIKSYSSRLAEVEEELTFFDAQEALDKIKWRGKLLRFLKIKR